MARIEFEISAYRLLSGPELEFPDAVYGYRWAGAVECTGKGGRVRIAAVPDFDEAGEPTLMPETLVRDNGNALLFVREWQFAWYLDLLRNEAPVRCVLDTVDKLFSGIGAGPEPLGEAELAPVSLPSPDDLFAWLDAHPNVRAGLLWNGYPYPDWTEERRVRLRASCEAAFRHQGYAEPQDPPVNLAEETSPNAPARTVLSGADAESLWLGYAGHCLANEIGRRLPWSIANWPAEHVRLLLSASEMFVEAPDGFEVSPIYSAVTPCGVRAAWGFLVENRILGGSQLETVGRLLDWCRDNLVHMSGDFGWDNMRAHWGYGGLPPVSRIVAGTGSPHGFGHHTAGCYGTSGFLKAVLRAANIPVKVHLKPDTGGRHALPGFPSIGRYLCHGDDPYSRPIRTAVPRFSCEELLISESRFNQLFGSQLDRQTQARGVGRRISELSCIHPSLSMLTAYCADLAAGLGHADGQVYQDGGPNFSMTVQEMEAAGLWEMLDRTLAEWGGCDQIPTNW